MNFVLLNETTSAVALRLTPEDLGKIAQACTVQLNRDFGPFWGSGPSLVRVGKDSADIQPGEVVVAYVDALPEAPGAVAYHAVDGKAAPVVFVAVSMCLSVLSGPNSVAQATSHELCEAEGDPFINKWYDDGQGREYAGETCDAVESASYDEQGVTLSDFVLPSFFDPGSSGPRFSFLGTATAPFRTAPGGYQIVRSSGAGTEQHVTGKQRLMAERRHHWSSRAYRRGLRATPPAPPAPPNPPAGMPTTSLPDGFVAGGEFRPNIRVGGGVVIRGLLRDACALLLVGAAAACAAPSILTPPTGPNTAYPCGLAGHPCADGECCSNSSTCCDGTTCSAGYCEFIGDARVRDGGTTDRITSEWAPGTR